MCTYLYRIGSYFGKLQQIHVCCTNMLGKLWAALFLSKRSHVPVPPSRSNFVYCQSYLTMKVHFDKCAFHSSRTLPLFECTGASVRVSMQAHGCVGVQICYNLFRWLVVGFIRFPYVSSGDGEKIYCSHRFFRG